MENRRAFVFAPLSISIDIVEKCVIRFVQSVENLLFDFSCLLPPVCRFLWFVKHFRHFCEGDLCAVEITVHIQRQNRRYAIVLRQMRGIIYCTIRRQMVVRMRHIRESAAVVMTGVIADKHLDKTASGRHTVFPQPIVPVAAAIVYRTQKYRITCFCRHLFTK